MCTEFFIAVYAKQLASSQLLVIHQIIDVCTVGWLKRLVYLLSTRGQYIPLKPGDRGWRLLASLDPASLPAISAAAGLEAE